MTTNFANRDEFQRQPMAEKLIKLLASEVTVSPMVIDGPWGSGKTEFTLKLIKLFEEQEQGFNLIYIDAFKADHADNPLMTVLAEIIKHLPDEQKSSLLNKAIPVIRSLSKTIAKAATSWVLKQDSSDVIEGFESEIKEASDSLIDYSVEQLLKSHIDAEKNLAALQTLLEEISKDKPIVLFIDELDRCRPDFSVSILETIKHVFNVSNVQFVLITNQSQLLASVKHIYGSQLDAKRYLDKFLSFSFKLSATVGTNSHHLKHASEIHFSNLIVKSDVLKESAFREQAGRGIIGFSVDLVKSHHLSLREVETFVRYIEIYHTLSEGFQKNLILGYGLLRVMGVFIYSFSSGFAKELDRDIINGYSVHDFFGKTDLIEIENTKPKYYMEIIHAMFAMELTTNSELYDKFEKPLQDLKPKWEVYFGSMFSGDFHYYPDEGNLIHVKSAIRELMMLSTN